MYWYKKLGSITQQTDNDIKKDWLQSHGVVFNAPTQEFLLYLEIESKPCLVFDLVLYSQLAKTWFLDSERLVLVSGLRQQQQFYQISIHRQFTRKNTDQNIRRGGGEGIYLHLKTRRTAQQRLLDLSSTVRIINYAYRN
jgi:hypothetical protein